MELREKLIKLRDESGLSQQEFADKLNVSRQTIARWEAGKSVPSSAQIVNVCKVFSLDANEFLETPKSENAKTESKKKFKFDQKTAAVFVVGFLILLALVGLIVTIVYALKDAHYDTSATVWIISVPQNTPMIVLCVFLAVFIALLVALLISLLRRKKP